MSEDKLETGGDEAEVLEAGPNSRERRAARKRTGDRALAVAGFTLATAAAFFPWYVFFNQESFGIAPMGYSETRDLPETQGRSVVSVSPLAIPDGSDGAPEEASAFDPIVTATVPGEGGESAGSTAAIEADPNQSFPGKPLYRLLHVANGRALIEDKTGMYIVRVGSVLPDNSRLATLEQRDGRWVIVTSNGEVIPR
ncbi:flagellar protein [uncultured Hoeflea sp.]|uniref:flagellar protein n=1 Tax=uncultured Hoeflea sp. TaxID=538666 RepID=UPI00262012F0|nr:flagellar protein [uncultured Hoeflea sp.]